MGIDIARIVVDGCVHRTQHSGHARELVKDALTKDGYNCVVSIGGDGTHGDVGATVCILRCSYGKNRHKEY